MQKIEDSVTTDSIGVKLPEMTKYDEDEELVVKVCDTNDIGMYNSAFNEYQILKKLNCQYTS